MRESFDAAWLALREDVDHRSRARALLAPLEAWWRARQGRSVVDLGAGTGSNLRYIAPALGGLQEWMLVDHDVELLSRVEAPGDAVRVTTLRADLNDWTDPGDAPVDRADLVTASAILDLVSEAWIGSVVDACTRTGAAALFALTYDGTVAWSATASEVASPDEVADAQVLAAVNRHQLRDKGFGPALGPAAGRTAAAAFRQRGYRTRLEPSPWVLGAADGQLAAALVHGWAHAAAEVLPGEAARLRSWAGRRTADVEEGRATLTVGHVDLLALPPETARP